MSSFFDEIEMIADKTREVFSYHLSAFAVP